MAAFWEQLPQQTLQQIPQQIQLGKMYPIVELEQGVCDVLTRRIGL